MIGHLVGAFEPERLAGSLTTVSFWFPRKNSKSITVSLLAPAILGMTGFSKVPTFYMQLRQH